MTVRGRFGVNNHGLMQLLAERGPGIAALTPALVQSAVLQGRLVPVLAAWSVPRLPIHAVVASHLQSAAVRAFVDFLAQRFSERPAHTLFERLAPLRVEGERMNRLLCLFELRFKNPADMRPAIAGRPVYLAMAMDSENKLKLKPQNLLLNLPLNRA